MFEDSNIIDFFIICFKVFSSYDNSVITQTNYLTVVQDALANFTEVLPDIPDRILGKHVNELVELLKGKLRIAIIDYDLS